MSHPAAPTTWYSYSIPGPAYTRRIDIRVPLSAQNGIPPTPYELQPLISNEEFHYRMNGVMGLLARYAWTVAERVFIVVTVLLSFVLPVTLAMVLRRIFLDQARATNQDATEFVLFEAERRASFEGRMVGLSAFVGIVFLLWVPYMLFKRMGNRRMAALLDSFTDTDANRGPQVAMKWTFATCSVFSRTALVSVALPTNNVPSNFHPQAYLPAYMAKANEESFTQSAPPLPRAVAVGVNVATWVDEKR